MSDRTTLDVYDAKAAEYAKLTDGEVANPDIARFLSAVTAGGHVLDLGCGPGTHAAKLAEAGLTVDAWDASAEMAKLAAALPGVSARHASFDDVQGTAIYDGIWANFSLLHADPDKFDTHIAQIAEALKPGGAFHIGMKSGTGTKRDPLGRRYTYVTEDSLTASLTRAGLTPLEHRTGEDMGLDGVMAKWISMLARKDA